MGHMLGDQEEGGNKLHFPPKIERDVCVQTWTWKAQMEGVQKI